MNSHIQAFLGFLFCLLLCQCRGVSPVERHFLRIPAAATGGLSTVERSQWLKQSVKANPEIRKTARRDGLLVLPAFSSRQSPPLAGMEVLHRKGGAVAVVLKGSSPQPAAQKLALLQLVQNRYKNISNQIPATREADVWRLDGSGPGAITGYRIVGRSGRQLTLRPAIQLVWDGHHWLSGKATGAPVRYQFP